MTGAGVNDLNRLAAGKLRILHWLSPSRAVAGRDGLILAVVRVDVSVTP